MRAALCLVNHPDLEPDTGELGRKVMPMEAISPSRSLQDFLGSAAAFTYFLHQVIESGALRHLAGTQVTFAQLKLLSLVAHQNRWSVSEVAACLHISDGAASKIVDRLVCQRLLQRAEAAEDRRVAALSLTERGERLLRAYFSARNRRLGSLFRDLSPKELERNTHFLDCLSIAIRRQAGQQDETCLHCGTFPREHCLLREQAPEACFYARRVAPMRTKVRNRYGKRHS